MLSEAILSSKGMSNVSLQHAILLPDSSRAACESSGTVWWYLFPEKAEILTSTFGNAILQRDLRPVTVWAEHWRFHKPDSAALGGRLRNSYRSSLVMFQQSAERFVANDVGQLEVI